MPDIKRDNYEVYNGSQPLPYTTWKLITCFVAEYSYSTDRLDLYCHKNVVGSSTLRLDVYLADANHEPTGGSLSGVDFSTSDLSASVTWQQFTLDTTLSITESTEYCIVATMSYKDGSSVMNWDGDRNELDSIGYYAGYFEGENWVLNQYWGFDFRFYEDVPLPEKPTTPSPTNEKADTSNTTANLTWADGGNTDTFSIYFGTESGSLTELETEIDVNSPTWTSPMVVLEIKDYNPEATSGYRSPVAGDVLTGNDNTYTLWDIKRGDLVNAQYEAKLYAFRTGPASEAGNVLTNGVSPDPNDPQAVSVTLNDEWYFTGTVESANYAYATRYYWRVDAVNEAGTTTGDEWYFDTQSSWQNERPPGYDEDLNWVYTDGSYQWADIDVAGGGRYKQNLVIIGHNSIYFG